MENVSQTQQCPYVAKCGACHIGEKSYEEELAEKREYVVRHIGKYCSQIHDVAGMYYPYHYRNKVHAVFGKIKDEVVAGTYAEGTHTIIPVSGCFIEDTQASAIIQTVTQLIKSFKLWVYNEDTGRGLMRHILVRKGASTKQIMVVLVTASAEFPHKNHFVTELRRRHPEITTIVQNINDKQTTMVLGDREKTLFGPGFIEDVLMGLWFRISPSSFYQVNTAQTQVLYKKAIQAAALTGKEHVIDAYCGIGTIGMCMSAKAGRVTGIELNQQAVKDAKANAKRNNIKNMRFIAADATEYMTQMSQNGERADVIVMDPPRSGSTEAFVRAAASLKPSRIVYVSCEPETLGRDLAWFRREGYHAREAWPVDMFAFTECVETIVLLSHKSPDSVINVTVEFGEGEGKVPLDAIAERAKKYLPKPKITYKMIQEYIEKKYGFKVHTAYIAEVKRSLGLTMYDAPNAVEELKHPRKRPPKEKVEAITEALKYFEVI